MPRATRQHGFSLLELAVAIAAVGALGLLLSQAYQGGDALRAQQQAEATLQQAHEALQAFALAHGRLPCPDTDGDRREGDAAGNCPATARVGLLPAETLGLMLAVDALPRYAVTRDGAAGADLVAPTALAASGDPQAAHPALLAALASAAAQPARNSEPYLTGDGSLLGAVDCGSNVGANPAVVLLAAAIDRDGDGSRFDAPHTGSAGHCFAAPTLPATATYDDRVLAVPALTLLGWLRTRTR